MIMIATAPRVFEHKHDCAHKQKYISFVRLYGVKILIRCDRLFLRMHNAWYFYYSAMRDNFYGRNTSLAFLFSWLVPLEYKSTKI